MKKKRAPQDSTLRNVRAAVKRERILDAKIAALHARILALGIRVGKIERALDAEFGLKV